MVVEMESEVFAHEEARSRASVKRRCYMTFGQKMYCVFKMLTIQYLR